MISSFEVGSIIVGFTMDSLVSSGQPLINTTIRQKMGMYTKVEKEKYFIISPLIIL